MDELNDFMDFSKPFERVNLAAPAKRMSADPKLVDVEVSSSRSKRSLDAHQLEKDYATEYRREEVQRMIQKFTNFKPPSLARSRIGSSITNGMDSLTDFDTETDTTVDDDGYGAIGGAPLQNDPICDKYLFNYTPPHLPIVFSRTDIIQTIADNPVVVLQGATGCGKSTQVPQMIMADAFSRREYCNIIVTQPRRIAAFSLASRVCNERKLELGTLVGYQVGLNTKTSEDTRLTFCTTGVLLEKLIRQKNMNQYTHIVLDEVHERDQDMDFLFIVVRRLLATNSSSVKIILMSATIEAPLFAKYFELPSRGRELRPAPIIQVERKSMFTVREFYLDDLAKLKISIQPNWEDPTIINEMYLAAIKIIILCDRLDVQNSIAAEDPTDLKPTILIFLPGVYEISRMYEHINKWKNMSDLKQHIIPLHSTISHEEQQKVFRPTPAGIRKIILATNIAESSITVPDVKYVIDFGLTKQLMTDSATGLTSLQLLWAARNNLRQRSGRAGRLMNGRVYRLIPKEFFEHRMQESGTPEMLRSPMANIVLKSKILDMGPPQSILALAMDPPDLTDINNTILVLKEVGALLRFSNETYSDLDGDLTFVGRIMASLPLDIRVARLVVLGHCFGLLEDMIIMAAGLTVKSIFSHPFTQPLKAYSNKLSWSDGSGSDLLAVHKAYTCWHTKTTQGHFENYNTDRIWAKRYFLEVRSLREMHQLVTELKDRLLHFGIKEQTGRPLWTKSEKHVIYKMLIAGAFYPNFFIRSGVNEEIGDREAHHRLNGRDPCNTVYFSGFDQKYIGPLYQQNIKDLLKDCTPDPRSMLVSFDNTSEKIFVTFRKIDEDSYQAKGDSGVEVVPGQVATEVYKAIKYQKLQLATEIHVMQPNDAIHLAEEKGLGMWEMGQWVSKQKFLKNPEMVCIPRLNVKEVHGKITHIQNLYKFWFQSTDENSMVNNIFDELNQLNTDIEPFEKPYDIELGQILAAPGPNTDDYYRARVEHISQSKSEQWSFDVFYIDIGSSDSVEFCKLRRFRGVSAQFVDVPARVFECRLAEIAPSSLNATKSQWTDNAKAMFIEQTDNQIVIADVYSVVNGVANVHILNNNGNVNEYLVYKKEAQFVEENYMSKANHEVRQRSRHIRDDNGDNHDVEAIKSLGIDHYLNVDPPDPKRCPIRVKLRGPLSPLEATLRIASDIGGERQVMVEPNSVNSVLLDAGNDSYEKLLVAAKVTESQNSSKIVARETTLMPNIPGFAVLVGLIFSPYMEPMRNKLNSRYISMLCGLGQHPVTKEAIFPEHDIRFNVDVLLTQEDMTKINKLRFIMSSLLLTKTGQDKPHISDNYMQNYMTNIKKCTVELLEKQRPLQPVEFRRHKWGLMDKKDTVVGANIYGTSEIFPAHKGLILVEKTSADLVEYYMKLNENAKELIRLSSFDNTMPRPVRCKLCDIELSTISMIRIHLHSRLHKDRLDEIKMPGSYD